MKKKKFAAVLLAAALATTSFVPGIAPVETVKAEVQALRDAMEPATKVEIVGGQEGKTVAIVTDGAYTVQGLKDLVEEGSGTEVDIQDSGDGTLTEQSVYMEVSSADTITGVALSVKADSGVYGKVKLTRTISNFVYPLDVTVKTDRVAVTGGSITSNGNDVLSVDGLEYQDTVTGKKVKEEYVTHGAISYEWHALDSKNDKPNDQNKVGVGEKYTVEKTTDKYYAVLVKVPGINGSETTVISDKMYKKTSTNPSQTTTSSAISGNPSKNNSVVNADPKSNNTTNDNTKKDETKKDETKTTPTTTTTETKPDGTTTTTETKPDGTTTTTTTEADGTVKTVKEKENADGSLTTITKVVKPNGAVTWTKKTTWENGKKSVIKLTKTKKGVVTINTKDTEKSGKYVDVTYQNPTGKFLYASKGKCTAAKVVFPANITANGKKYQVKGCNAGFMKNNKKVQTVQFSKTMSQVKERAFYKDSKLAKVVFKCNMTELGKQSFAGAKSSACFDLQNVSKVQAQKISTKLRGKASIPNKAKVRWKKPSSGKFYVIPK